jgi:hypothetical protein
MRYIILLTPEHGPIEQHLKWSGIEKPVVHELEPRAGMRCFEVSDGCMTDGLIEYMLALLRTSYRPG